MRKLVFGIIAVVLLQVAFYSYVAINSPTEETADVRRPNPVAKVPEFGRVQLPPAEVPAEPKQDPEISPKIARAKASEKPAVQSRQTGLVAAARPVPEQKPAKGDRISSGEQFPERRIARAKASPAIPRGYTMVLVDYTNGGLPVVYSKARIRPVNRRTPVATPNLDSERRVPEISKTDRKRPYLARALPALVKKPWKWMKSLASKLN